MANTYKHKNYGKNKRNSWYSRWQAEVDQLVELGFTRNEAVGLVNGRRKERFNPYAANKEYPMPKAVKGIAIEENRKRRHEAKQRIKSNNYEDIPNKYKRNAWWLAY
jgi:hypothetical protein